MRYVLALRSREQLEVAFYTYATEALKMTSENTARFAGGSYLQKSYAEIAGLTKPDNRTGTEIAADVIKRAGLVVN